MTPIRVRGGRVERYCARANVWYWALATHVHRYHRTKTITGRNGQPKVVANCRCVAVCGPKIASGRLAVA